MKLNQNSHFALTPAAVNMERSILDRSKEHLTTFDAAKIVPIFVDEVLPGDSINAKKVNALIRLTTSIHPTMDRAYEDIYFFFVPNRLVWSSWEEFCGENPNPWTLNAPVHSIPQVTLTNVACGDMADYFGIPQGYSGDVNALPFRCYNKIFNDWFRNTNVESELALPMGDTGDLIAYYPLQKASKFKDYFTAGLPSPQRGPDVDIPLGTKAPIVANSNIQFVGAQSGKTMFLWNDSGSVGANTTNGVHLYNAASAYTSPGEVLKYGGGLEVDLTGATPATINQLRLAFQTQKFYERMGIASGGRYISVLKTMFGVTSPDYRLQRSEYLGGSRSLINMSQVTQSSETATTPLGETAGQSVTRISKSFFHKGFTEHGYIIGVQVVRTKHTYSYGIDKMWLRKDLLDFYWPTFAFIGEQPILNKEIYAQGDSVVDSDGNIIDNQVFAYQEAWAEYRYGKNVASGYFSPKNATSLDSWHYADKYAALPTLGATWMKETDANIARTLAVQGGVHQFIAHYDFEFVWTRVMPVYSVPGLIDHF